MQLIEKIKTYISSLRKEQLVALCLICSGTLFVILGLLGLLFA